MIKKICQDPSENANVRIIQLLDAIILTPTADVVEVTYCNDCKLRDTESCPLTYWNGGELVSNVEDTDFCSYGVRKDK